MKQWVTKNDYLITQLLGGRSNVFLLQAESYNILIDTGPAFMWKILNARLKKIGISKVDYLILTHTHFDHAANAYKIKSIYHAKIMVHSLEANCLATGTNPAVSGTSFISKIISKLGTKAVNLLKYKACTADYLVDSIFDLNIININAVIVHTPGHTSGSLSLIVDDEIAMVGDCMFGVFPNKVLPPFAENLEKLLESWKTLLKHSCKTFLPSHGWQRSRKQVITSRIRLLSK